MAPRRSGWKQLIPGLIALACVVGAALAVLMFARIGAMRGAKVILYSASNEARGVMKGTEVWLAGKKIGAISDINFRSVNADSGSGARVVLTLSVLEKWLPLLRRDSYAQVRPGGRLIAAPVIFLTIGTPNAAALLPDDTLTARPQEDNEGMASQLAIASRDFPEIISNIKLLNTQLVTARGTAGALLDAASGEKLDVVKANATQLTRRAMSGTGSLSLAMRRGDVMSRAQRAMSSADTLKQLLSTRAQAIGRFRRDSTLLQQVADVRNQVSIVKFMLTEPRGTAGRVLADSAIVRQLGQLESQLGAVMADIKARPFRYVAF